jgi:acetyl esterase/lipase
MVSGAALLMDAYRPVQSNGLGVLYLGGGGWASGPEYSAIGLKDTAFVPLLNALAKAGYTVFAINYRTTPVFSYPEPLADVRRAIRFVRHSANPYGIDPNRIGGFGGSAGGHLIALAALTPNTGDAGDLDPINRQSTRIQAMALVAAPLDFLAPDFAGPAMGAFMRMRPPAANAPESSGQVRLYRDASPITHISADDPPTLLIHGDADTQVPLRQSEAFNTALQKVNVPSKLVVVPGGDHGATFGLAAGVSRPPNWPDYIGEIVGWFDLHLKSPRIR